jgi:hypothetical protein
LLGTRPDSTTVADTEGIRGSSFFRWCQIGLLITAIAHFITVPIGITYDGHIYIGLADVLGTDRFPQEWHPARTPLFPLGLKLSFWALGRQPLAAVFLSTALITAGILVTGRWANRLAGPWAGGITIAVLAIYPTLVAYGHLVLTEAGVFALLSLLVSVSLQRVPSEAPAAWRKAASLALLLTIGYYWRQNLLILAPLLALIHGVGAWFAPSHAIHMRSARVRNVAAQTAIICILPWAAAQPWRLYMNEKSMIGHMLMQSMVRQALPPPDHEMVRSSAKYIAAIEQSKYRGTLYSGIRPDLCAQLIKNDFVWPKSDQVPRLFVRLTQQYPGRYLQSAWRTFALLAGADALENENRLYRDQILSPTFVGSKIGEGPQQLYQSHKEQFLQRTGSSAVLRLLYQIAPTYDFLLIVAFATALAGTVFALLTRQLDLFAICAIPMFYVAHYAVTLMSVNRYGMPTYPIVMAASIVLYARLLRALVSRRNIRSNGRNAG